MSPNKLFSLLSGGLILAAGSCSTQPQIVSLGLDDRYVITRMSPLTLKPAIPADDCKWQMLIDGEWKTIATTPDYTFIAVNEGDYMLKYEITDTENPVSFTFSVVVTHEEVEYSKYIAKVHDYLPAPGQYVNMLPMYEEGDSHEDMIRKVENSICGENTSMITLGGFGGYVVFSFDHTVVNVPGEADFQVFGNALYAGQSNDPSQRGGSSEPGIISVSFDVNGNGLPDDPWYELAGSEASNPLTLYNYTITYHTPDPSREILTEGSSIIDALYIQWNDSQGLTGYVKQNTFHRQAYFPQWVDTESLTFTATRLPGNASDISGQGTQFILPPFAWGYADNHPNDEKALNSFDISNAIDANGYRVSLPGVDFIRVHTATNQSNGWLGESSTELTGALDLHM